MAASCRRLLAVCLLVFAAPLLLRGQDGAVDRSSVRVPVDALPTHYPGTPSAGVFQELFLRQLVRAAGIIFSGRVTSIGQFASSSRPDPTSTVVTFQVEHAIRGALPGQNLTIHEWAGLRFSGEHYRVGERVLLFLYSPSKLGLTSPVAGAMGRFAMNSQGQVVMNAQHVAALAGDPMLGGKTVVPYAPSHWLCGVQAGRNESSVTLAKNTARSFFFRLTTALAIVLLFAVLARAGGPEYVAGSSYFSPSMMGQPITWSRRRARPGLVADESECDHPQPATNVR